MKKPLIQLMKDAGVEWPEEADFAAQDKEDLKVYFYICHPVFPEKGYTVWAYSEDEWAVVVGGLVRVRGIKLPELCKKWRKTLITKKEYLGAS